MKPENIVIEEKKCTGCRACEYACAFKQRKLFHYDLALIRVSRDKEDRGHFVPILCRHCEDPPCAAECPVGAIVRDEDTGLVRIDGDVCNGCRICLEVCPWGVPNFKTREDIATVCDLCGGDPLCVQYCASGALILHGAD